MMKKILYTLISLLILPLAATAQTTLPYDGRIAVDFPDYMKNGDQVTFCATIDFSALELKTNQVVEFTPLLRSTRSGQQIPLESIRISGRQREKIRHREEHFGHRAPEAKPARLIVLKKETERTTRVEITVPFEKWMRHAELLLIETTAGCQNLPLIYDNGATEIVYRRTYNFPEPYQPVYSVAYIVPPVEPVKILSDTHSAQLSFRVNQSTLLPEFGNNAAVLAQVDRMIETILNDSLLTVKSIRVAGYASPEGNEAANLKLSTDRAQAFVNYLKGKNGALSQMASSEGRGEDWNGLIGAIEQSESADREAILAAIRSTEDAGRRKSALKNLSGGRIWRTLLEEYFPPLRRNEYTIEYEVRGFNAQEAAGYARTRPELLSLNEFFMAAHLYPAASAEFKEIFAIARRMFPDSPAARCNTAAAEIENGEYDSAVELLTDVDSPEGRNNRAIAHWKKGEYQKARELFSAAARDGLPQAVENLRQFEIWEADKDE